MQKMCALPQTAIHGVELLELSYRVKRLKDNRQLTVREANNLWKCACETFFERTRNGHAPKQVKRAICDLFRCAVPGLAASVKTFERKLKRFEGGQTTGDGRTAAGKARRAPKLSERDHDQICRAAVFDYPSLDMAWRALLGGQAPGIGLNTELLARFAKCDDHNARCPESIRRQVSAEIKRLRIWNRSPRQARLTGPYISRSWDQVHAGDVYVFDDWTPPVYGYVPDGKGWYTLLRGQILLALDAKSLAIPEFARIGLTSYDSGAARRLLDDLCSWVGVPRVGFHMESGIWKKAAVLGGGTEVPWLDEILTGADLLGIRIIHSLPGNPKAKPIEGVIKQIEKYLVNVPGFCGPDERRIKYDGVEIAKKDVSARRRHPAEAGLLSWEELGPIVEHKIEQYNRTEQDSAVIMGGHFSPQEVWQTKQARNAVGDVVGLTRIGAEHQSLLRQPFPATVTRGRIKVRFSDLDYAVGDGFFEGQKVIGYWKASEPDRLLISDAHREQYAYISPVENPDAYMASPDAMERAARQVQKRNRFESTELRRLKLGYLPPSRPVVTDAIAANRFHKIEVAGQEHQIAATEIDRLRETERQKSRERRRKLEECINKYV